MAPHRCCLPLETAERKDLFGLRVRACWYKKFARDCGFASFFRPFFIAVRHAIDKNLFRLFGGEPKWFLSRLLRRLLGCCLEFLHVLMLRNPRKILLRRFCRDIHAAGEGLPLKAVFRVFAMGKGCGQLFFGPLTLKAVYFASANRYRKTAIF